MLKILSERERLILRLTVAIICGSILFNFILIPLFRKNDTLNREIELMKARLSKYQLLITDKEKITAAYTALLNRSKPLEKSLNLLTESLSELENLARSSNIRLIDIRPQANQGEKENQVFIDVKTEGSLTYQLKFIYSVENSISLFNIERFQLNSRQNSENLEANFTISRPAD